MIGLDGILLKIENIRYNLGIKWKESIQIRKNHRNFMDPQLMFLKPTAGIWSVLQKYGISYGSYFIAVMKNLNARGIQGDIFCSRCGDQEESINHVFFYCPPARQVWALSKIPSNPNIFTLGSFFTNMDYLFWRVNPKMDDHQFAWILWYIWKSRNNKVFSNIDVDPRDTLWAEVQVLRNQRVAPDIQNSSIQTNTGLWCFIDGSWKDKAVFSGQGWFSTLPGFDGLLGARNARACLSPLHSEVEALIWAMECMRNLR